MVESSIVVKVVGAGRQVGPRCRRFGENSTLFLPKAKARSKGTQVTTENMQDELTTMTARGTKERQGLK